MENAVTLARYPILQFCWGFKARRPFVRWLDRSTERHAAQSVVPSVRRLRGVADAAAVLGQCVGGQVVVVALAQQHTQRTL